MKDHAMLFVKRSDEVAKLWPEHTLKGPLFRRDNVHLDLTGAQRGCDLKTDEACADDDRAFCFFGIGDDAAAVGKRTQGMDVRLIRAGEGEFHGLGAGG